MTSNESRHHWYKEIEHIEHKTDDEDHTLDIELIESIKHKHEEDQTRIHDLVRKVREKEDAELSVKRKQSVEATKHEAQIQADREKLQKYVNAFMETVGRNPHIDEVSENMKDSVSRDAIEAFRHVL